MAQAVKAGEYYEEIGFTALRSATGEFLPRVPLYRKVSPNEIDPKTGMSHGEKLLIDDVGQVFADKFKEYANGTKKQRKDETL